MNILNQIIDVIFLPVSNIESSIFDQCKDQESTELKDNHKQSLVFILRFNISVANLRHSGHDKMPRINIDHETFIYYLSWGEISCVKRDETCNIRRALITPKANPYACKPMICDQKDHAGIDLSFC